MKLSISGCARLVCLASALLFSSVRAVAADEAPRPYLAPWIVAPAGTDTAALIASLAAAPAAPLSPNSGGILLELSATPDDASARAAGALIAAAHRAGLRVGVGVSLPEVAVPTEPRAAEAASAETLYRGLGQALRAVRAADLIELHFPDLGDVRRRIFVLKKLAAEARAAVPDARIAVTFTAEAARLFPAGASDLLANGAAAYVDMVGLRFAETERGASAESVRAAADELAFGRPLLVRMPPVSGVDALLAAAGRFAPIDAPFVAAPFVAPAASEDFTALARIAKLLSGDFARDTRAASAQTASGTEIPVTRLVSGTDLGGIVLVHATSPDGTPARGPAVLTLDGPDYSAAEVFELHTGRSRRFDIPRTATPPKLTLSTATGMIAVVLTAREKAPAEASREKVGVTATRGLTAEEILARHSAWRARRDARWSRFTAQNRTSVRFRFADLNNTLDLTLAGPFFYEPGKGYDWLWSEAYFNGVKWKGKKIPELPLLQPEKVSELPLALTFNDAYVYTLKGEETVNGVRCHVLDFQPKQTFSDKPIYAGRVAISTTDFALIRTDTRQLNLSGEVQSVDERSDFTEVPAPDGGEPLRFPTHTSGQWVMRTFSRTTVLERDTTLEGMKLDPPDYDALKTAAYASKDVMVRDTDKGVRYLEKTKEGERVVVEDPKSSRLFGLGGVFYDTSLDFPLPLLGVYYLDLDFRKKHQQAQVFFGGVLLAASFNEPSLLGSKVDLGFDVFGIAVRGTDSIFVDGTEDKTQRVKQRSFAGNLNLGYPIARHVKVSATLGVTHRDFAESTDETSPDFAIPSNHWVTRLQGQAIWDLSGFALSARYAYNKRSQWDPWGAPGNVDYDPGKDAFQTWSFQLAKDFHFASFRRIRSSVAYLGSSNTDRFSKYSFGNFGGNALKGFSSGRLRAEQAAIARFAYGIAVGSAFRLEGVYDHAFVKDRAAGYDWASFGGAGLSGEFPGFWSTLVRLDAGVPVVGRNRGQRGFSVNLVFLKIF